MRRNVLGRHLLNAVTAQLDMCYEPAQFSDVSQTYPA